MDEHIRYTARIASLYRRLCDRYSAMPNREMREGVASLMRSTMTEAYQHLRHVTGRQKGEDHEG